MIEVAVAPPFATIQDLGRPGYRAYGVPVAGAMDADALALANALADNPPNTAAIEWAVGGGTLLFRMPARFALAGAVGEVHLNQHAIAVHAPVDAPANSTLTLSPPAGGRFLYVAVSGGIDVPVVLGSRSTYLAGRFGGHEGRTLRTGDVLPIGTARGAAPAREAPRSGAIRVIPGPHRNQFTEAHWMQFLATEYRVSPTADRTGYRLDGPALTSGDWGTLPSEPVCPGAIQITAGGTPIALMADAPTLGGYPVIAVVHSADIGSLAQRVSGASVQFFTDGSY